MFEKIVNMSRTYQFAPDDFARMTLMESDGMNPKASNNRCHGIIQFCDGPDRGAASAGFGNNPKAILGHSVLQQLDMVAKYFDETGLKGMGPTSLDDLYLTVLTPSARSIKAPDANLNIAGAQAKQLYVNRDKGAPHHPQLDHARLVSKRHRALEQARAFTKLGAGQYQPRQ